VYDSAVLLSVMAGKDERDATSLPDAVEDYAQLLEESITGMRIGVPDEFFAEEVDPGVKEAVMEALKAFEKQGAKLVRISLPLTAAGVPTYYLLAKAEGSANMARYDGLRFAGMELTSHDLVERYMEARGKGLGAEVKRTILMGTYALSAGYADEWYKQASKVRTLIRQEYETAFKEVDVIAGPTTVETSFPLGSKSDDPLQMYLTDSLVVLQPLAGIPAISIPCGFASVASTPRSPKGEVGLPVGLQLTAPRLAEPLVHVVAEGEVVGVEAADVEEDGVGAPAAAPAPEVVAAVDQVVDAGEDVACIDGEGESPL
jgi:aspartyl-tRNA(Asn)/glutamyl-tRNA(Gln) amidotransferase subunit A